MQLQLQVSDKYLMTFDKILHVGRTLPSHKKDMLTIGLADAVGQDEESVDAVFF